MSGNYAAQRGNGLSIFIRVTLTSCFLQGLAIPISSIFAIYNCVMDTARAKMMSDILSLLVVDFPYFLTLSK